MDFNKTLFYVQVFLFYNVIICFRQGTNRPDTHALKQAGNIGIGIMGV